MYSGKKIVTGAPAISSADSAGRLWSTIVNTERAARYPAEWTAIGPAQLSDKGAALATTGAECVRTYHRCNFNQLPMSAY